VEIMFGVASFHGTEPDRLARPLSLLHHRYLAPPERRVRARGAHFQSMNLIPADALDRRAAMLEVPALIKAYLRMGGYVGEGAYVDHQFNTTDVCLVIDTERLDTKRKSFYSKGPAR
jgi:putative hemolysin